MQSRPGLQITVRVAHRRELQARLLDEMARSRQEYERSTGTAKVSARARYAAALQKLRVIVAGKECPGKGGPRLC